MKSKPFWAVGHVLAGHEVSVQNRLRLQGCSAYLPVVARLTRPAGKRKPELVEVPLIPTYLFLDTRTVDDWGRVHEVRSILYFLGCDGRPVLLDDAKLDPIRSIEAEGAVESVTEPLPVFVIGERIRILDGPFGGLRGFVERFRDGRLRLHEGDLPFPVETGDLTNLARCA